MAPVRLILSKQKKETGKLASRFWGDPDLPEGFPYPSYTDSDGDLCEYQFICQINLKELHQHDRLSRLPEKGLLSFFAKIDHYLGYYESDDYIGGSISSPEDVKVLFFPDADADSDAERDIITKSDTDTDTDTDTEANTGNRKFKRQILIDEEGQRVNPEELHIRFSGTHETTEVSESLDEHALFAEPTHREWETWDHPYEDWEILLQIDSFDGKDFHLNFMDCGVFDFLISPEDLAASDFNKVRAIVLST